MSLSINRIKASTVISVLILLLAFQTILFADQTALLNRKVTLDAEDSSVSQVLSTMARISNCNIVLAVESNTDKGAKSKSPESMRTVTLHLKDVPIEQALTMVVKTVGLSYRLVGDNTFLVGKKARINEEIGERSYVINLNYTDAKKIVKALAIMPGKVVAIESQNSLLVVANPESYAEISKRIADLDIPQKQIEIRARLIEINLTESQKFGIDWSKLDHLTTLFAEDPTNGDGVGLPYNYTDETGALPVGDMTNLEQLPSQQYWQKMNDWSNVGHFSRQLTAFNVTVNWLMENNAAKLLTDTRLTAMNGEDASIHIGEIVPYVVTDHDNQVQVERASVGIKLKVHPTINRDGDITTKIEPEVSSVTELVGGYIPRTKIRKVTSTVTVPSGSTIIVGGLLNSSLTHKTNRIPFLSDIPFIGKLFTHKADIVSNTDLIIEITPRIVDVKNEQKTIDVDSKLDRHLIEFK